MKNRTFAFTFSFILQFNLASLSQDVFRDFQVWENFEIEYNINNKWLGKIQQQARISENSTQFAYYYFDLGIMYKITKNIRVNADYIFVQKQRLDQSFSTRHQYNFYFNFRKKIKRYTFFSRILTEGQFVDYNSSEYGRQLSDIYIRNKSSARYMLTKRITPYVSDEVYYKFDGKYYERNFNRNRLSLGVLYKLTRHWLFELFYIFEHNFNIKRPSQNFILGVGFSRSFYQ